MLTSSGQPASWLRTDVVRAVTGRVPLSLLWCAAAASLGVGALRAWSSPTDFASVMVSATQVAEGVSPYRVGPATDYPPWALVTLAPWTMWPEGWQLSLWVVLNLGLALGLAWSISRVSSSEGRADAAMAALLLCASCFRVLNQFSLLSMTFAWFGVRHSSPWVGGLWLGLGLMKPQIGGVFWVAHALIGDWRRAGVALAVPVVLTSVAAVLVGQSPLALVQDAAGHLAFMQGTSVHPPGHTELRVWLVQWWPDAMSLGVAAALAVVLLLPALRRGWRERASHEETERMALYGFIGAVSLLAVRHLSYDFLLFLPLLVSWRGRRWLFWALWIPLVVQIPGWWRQVLEPLGAPVTLAVLTHADRLVALAVWVVLSRQPK